MRYRRRPLEVEASQWNGRKEGPHDLGVMPYGNLGILEVSDAYSMVVSPGDWVVRPDDGRVLLVKPDDFEREYEEAE